MRVRVMVAARLRKMVGCAGCEGSRGTKMIARRRGLRGLGEERRGRGDEDDRDCEGDGSMDDEMEKRKPDGGGGLGSWDGYSKMKGPSSKRSLGSHPLQAMGWDR
ncbi:hypothetical protein AAC387_Pa02g1681 [Persea americana]